MKTFTKGILIVLCITLLSSSQLFGQEWSAEQKEVWKNVETLIDLIIKQDLEGMMEYLHDDITSWGKGVALPIGKAEIRKYAAHQFKKAKILIYDAKPVAIKIHDNVAIVQYYYSMLVKDAEGKETNRSGRWSETYMKAGDKWVIIGEYNDPATN